MDPSTFPTNELVSLINLLESGTLATNYQVALQDAAAIISFGIGQLAGGGTPPPTQPQARASLAPCPPCDPDSPCPELAATLKPALAHCRAMASGQAGAPQAGAVNWVAIVQTVLSIALSVLAKIPA